MGVRAVGVCALMLALGLASALPGCRCSSRITDSGAPGTDAVLPGTDAIGPGTDATAPGTDATGSGTDAGPSADGGQSSGASVPCGPVMVCDVADNEFCCIETVLNRECQLVGCLFGWVPLQCDGPEDCAGDDLCCGDIFDARNPSYCRPACLTAEVPLCHTGADCSPSLPYCCTFPGRTSCNATDTGSCT